MRVFALCAIVVAAALAVTAEPAHACSCAIVDAREALARFDGAFVGTLVGRKGESESGVTLVFRVEERFKGGLGATVDVRTPSNSAACGIEAAVGARMGLFLDREDGSWNGTLCSQVEPARLREAARPLPPPDGKGPVALVVGGRFGPVRTLALDRSGRTVAYGRGGGSSIAFSPCPGGRRLAEVALVGQRLVLAIRELPTLRLVRRQPLSVPSTASPGAVRCEDAGGGRVLVFSSSPDAPERARLLRIRPARTAVVWRGTAPSASLTDRLAYVNAGRRATALLGVDLRTGAVRRLGRLPAFTGPLVPNAGGRLLAGVAVDQRSQSRPSRIVVLALGGGAPVVHTARLGSRQVSGDVLWVGAARLAFFPHYGVDDVRVYDEALRPVSRFPGWRTQKTALVGSTAFGVGVGDGRLLRASLPSGPVRVARRLPGLTTHVIVSAAR
jgi:hypothetical protein